MCLIIFCVIQNYIHINIWSLELCACKCNCTCSCMQVQLYCLYFSFIDSFKEFKVHFSCFSGKLVPFNDCRRMKVNYTFSDPTAFQFNRGILGNKPCFIKIVNMSLYISTDLLVQCCSLHINVACSE